MSKGLKALIEQAGASRLRRNLSAIATGQIVSQAIALASAPVLTRLFQPSDFALLALFTGGIALALCLANWRFDWVTSLPRTTAQAAACLALGFAATVTLAAAGGAALWLGLALPAGLLPQGGNLAVEVLLPFAILIVGFDALQQGWFVRRGDLTIVAKARIVQSLVVVGLSLGLWFIAPDGTALVWATVGGYLASLLVGLVRWPDIAPHLRRLKLRAMRATLARYGNAATLSVASSINQAIVTSLLPVLLLWSHSATEVGWFMLMHRVALSPISFISVAISQGFWVEAAKLIHTDPVDLRRLYVKISLALTLLAVPVVVICAFGPLYIGTIFGKAEWSGAGWVLTALVPFIFGQIVMSPLNHLLTHDRAGWVLAWDIGRVVLVGGTTILVGSMADSIVTTVLALSLAHLASYLILMALHFRSYAQKIAAFQRVAAPGAST